MIEKPRNNAAFYISVALYIVYIFLVNWTTSAEKMKSIWLYGSFSSLANLVLIACCVMIIYKIARDFSYYAKHKWFTFISITTFVFLAIVVNSISIVLPLILGFIGINSQDKITAKTIVKSLIALLLISSLFYFLGLSGGDTTSKPLFGDDSHYSITVPALGLSNPNSVMLIFVNIIALSLFLCATKRQTMYTSIVLFIATIVLASITGSTTGLLIGLAAIVLINAVKNGKKISNFFRKIAPWALIIVTIVSFVVATNYGTPESIPNSVNDALTTRPYMWNLRIENNSYLNIIGNNDQYPSEGSVNGGMSYSLDNMVLYALVHYGIIVYLIFFYIFYSGAKKIKNPAILVYIFIVCILMLVERMYLYSIVLVFLQKEITEYYLFEKYNVERNINVRI